MLMHFRKCLLHNMLTTLDNVHNSRKCLQLHKMLTIPQNAHNSRKCSQLTIENAHNPTKC